MLLTSTDPMIESFPALEERPPFEGEAAPDLDTGDNSPSERVAEVLAAISKAGFFVDELIELAIYACGEAAAELGDELSADAIEPEAVGSVVESITRLQVAAEILKSVDLGEADEDDEAEPEDDLAA